MFSALRFIAAGVIIALFGGFFLTGALPTQHTDEMAPAGATESPTATAAAVVDTAVPSAGPEEASPAPVVAGPGPWLVWERAPEFDESVAERYERLYGQPTDPLFAGDGPISGTFEQGDYVLGVRDGDATRSDPHGLLDGYIPLRLWVLRPDGGTEKHTIDRAYRVRNVAIGPAGILVRTTKAAADGGVEQLAVAGRLEKGERSGRCCELQPDGTVTTDGSGGLPGVIRFGQYRDKLQRIGLRRADLAGPRYWLWRDGAGWTEIEAPPDDEPVMATEDGYFVLGKDGRLHFSADLLDWVVVDERPGQSSPPASWLRRVGDRVLYVADDEIAWVGSGGLQPTPLGQAVKEAGPVHTYEAEPIASWGGDLLLPWPGSDEGLVLIDTDTRAALFAPGGEAWGMAPLAVSPCAGKGCYDEFEVRDGQLVQFQQVIDWDQAGDGVGSAYRAVVTDKRPD